ncbi:MAG: cysteine desulfurase [Planctomycetota bacterium]|nr:cysteine desulfurase [Planctomycetota bacterium]
MLACPVVRQSLVLSSERLPVSTPTRTTAHAVIYADHNSTTPPLPAVIAAMHDCLRDGWGNPAARAHSFGRRAAQALESARRTVASVIAAEPDEIIFTSGATEALNLAICGLGERLLATRPRIVVGATEHPAALAPCQRLAEAGAELVVAPVDGDGRLDPRALAEALTPGTGLLVLMLANHDTGVIHDVATWSRAAHEQGALVVCDATQAVGRMPVDVQALGVDALAFTAHKLYGPQGAGALWLRAGLGLTAQIVGGGQEGGRRAGTPNLPGIVGFAAACAAAARELAARIQHLQALTELLEERLLRALPEIVIHGRRCPRVPGTTMVTLPGLAPGWLATQTEIAVSGGAACAAGEPSATLLAMGVPRAEAANAIRISLGIATTPDEAMAIADSLRHGAAVLRRRP